LLCSHLEFNSLVSSLLTVNATMRPLISEIGSHSWMMYCPSIRPSWYDTSDKYTLQTCLPSYLHSVKPRHLCPSQSSSCRNAVAPYAHQLPLGEVRDTNLSRGADAGISAVLEDIAESGEVTCDQVKSATCAPACMEVDAAGIVDTVSFAAEKATDVSESSNKDNTNLKVTAKNDMPSYSIHLILLHQK